LIPFDSMTTPSKSITIASSGAVSVVGEARIERVSSTDVPGESAETPHASGHPM
jgi:hypothetical protein